MDMHFKAAFLLMCSILLVVLQSVHFECPLTFDTSDTLPHEWTKKLTSPGPAIDK